MILIYTTLLAILGTIAFLVRRRVASLEKKYARIAEEADKLVLQQAAQKPSNSKLDTAASAKRQYVLGQLIQKRDSLEAKHLAWLGCAERFGKLQSRLRAWKGRKLPYTMGVLDVSGVLYLIDYYGVGRYVSIEHVVQTVTALMNQ